MGTPLSIRLSDEVKEEFKNLSDQTGMKQEDFVATLIATFKERQVETDTGSPVYRERQKVDLALAQIQRVVVGFLEIAHNDKEVAISKAQEQVEQTKVEIAELKENLKESKLNSEEITQAKITLEEKLTGLEKQANSLEALQSAWKEKETSLNARLADLDAEAKEARKSKTELAEAATKIMEQKNIIALAEQKGIATQETLTDIKTRLQNKDNALEKLRAELQQVKDTTNQQMITLTQEHAEKRGSLTAKIEFLSQKITDLESSLAEITSKAKAAKTK
ncbi:hypothetical protein FCL47_22345 [Desulfopila sp. IMCC35006]|uniref:hypothetical protein n=1 Tax=Desulfopila sp. IMCC35006 TaxID=2569542 RepID=UPI0010AD64CD|nr:hypothetical protein [Desulfopila sp. IMCC35006]TKB23498.1 hypothetical protein FCL47_22345 [Desulfopila sp. IMCC35006]